MLLNITGGADMGLFEVNEAAEIISGAADGEANVIFGAVIDESMADQMRVTVIATGFDQRAMLARAEAAAEEEAVEERPAESIFGLPKPRIEVDEDVLEIPPFLRDRD